MSDHTIKNLKDDVENASERFGLAPDMEARFARKAADLQGGGFSYQKLAPNYRPPAAHRHREPAHRSRDHRPGKRPPPGLVDAAHQPLAPAFKREIRHARLLVPCGGRFGKRAGQRGTR